MKPLARAGLALAGLLLGALAVEVAARMVFDRNGMHYGLEMWKYARALKRVSPVAEMGHEHVPDRAARLMGVELRTNALGLRDREIAPRPDPGTLRILALGDSMTLGWGVRLDETYPKVVETLLNGTPMGRGRVEVVNAGVGNYNTEQELAYFKARGSLLRPDMVLLGFYINDAEPRPVREHGLMAEHSYLYVLATSAIDALLRKAGLRESYADYYRGLYRDDAPGWQRCRLALEDLAAFCRARAIPLRVILIPELHFPGGRYPFAEVHATVVRHLGKLAVPVIDLQRAFEGVEPRTLWVSPGDAHPNATAHRIIAEHVVAALTVDGSIVSPRAAR